MKRFLNHGLLVLAMCLSLQACSSLSPVASSDVKNNVTTPQATALHNAQLQAQARAQAQIQAQAAAQAKAEAQVQAQAQAAQAAAQQAAAVATVAAPTPAKEVVTARTESTTATVKAKLARVTEKAKEEKEEKIVKKEHEAKKVLVAKKVEKDDYEEVASNRGHKSESHGGSVVVASWYGPGFHGRLTANGERYNMYDMTAASKTLPFMTQLRLRNVANGRTVVVRINDRGPYVAGRSLDLSYAAAQALGFQGVARVEVEHLGRASGPSTVHNQHAGPTLVSGAARRVKAKPTQL